MWSVNWIEWLKRIKCNIFTLKGRLQGLATFPATFGMWWLNKLHIGFMSLRQLFEIIDVTFGPHLKWPVSHSHWRLHRLYTWKSFTQSSQHAFGNFSMNLCSLSWSDLTALMNMSWIYLWWTVWTHRACNAADWIDWLNTVGDKGSAVSQPTHKVHKCVIKHLFYSLTIKTHQMTQSARSRVLRRQIVWDMYCSEICFFLS